MEHSLCFTGHRLQKLGFDEGHPLCTQLKERLKSEIEKKIQLGATDFYCGMALGTDMWCGQIVIELKKTYPHIRLIACVPHIGQEKSWSQSEQERYRALLAAADESVVFFEHYVNGCMQKRNRYMVDHCSHVIAVFNGSGGGTKTTLEYAQKKGLDIVVINP